MASDLTAAEVLNSRLDVPATALRANTNMTSPVDRTGKIGRVGDPARFRRVVPGYVVRF